MARWKFPLLGFVAAGVVAVLAYAALNRPSDASVLPPARTGLLPVPLPRLDSLEAAVVQQIDEFHRSFAELAARSDRSETDLAEGYGLLAQLYHAYGFFDAAAASYTNATRLAANDFRWSHLLGYLYHQNGRLEQSIGFYSAALGSRPDDFAARVYLGEVYLRLGRREEARKQFETVLARYPAAALNGLGEVALIEGRFEEAVRQFEAALQRVPRASRIHYSLAMAYRGLDRLDEAQAHLARVGTAGIQVADPVVDNLQHLLRGERVHLIQGQFAYQAGQFKAAADAYRKAIDAAPTSVTAGVNLGLALAALGDTEGASQQLRAALRLDPENVTAHFTLATLLARQERHAEAVDHFRAVISRTPDHVEANRELTRSLAKLGPNDEAADSQAAGRR
jgi:tetratricopeptide (TPR) repeat protein